MRRLPWWPELDRFGFHNIGVPQSGKYIAAIDTGRFDGIGKLVTQIRTSSSSTGRGNSAWMKEAAYLHAWGDRSDSATGKFKTPTLRNVSKTAPYMHDGAYQTLWDVVNHYNFGGTTANYLGERAPAIAPLDVDERGTRRSGRVSRGASGRRPESVGESDAAARPPEVRSGRTRPLVQGSQVAGGLLEDGTAAVGRRVSAGSSKSMENSPKRPR